jgi:hypothetical protein
LASSLAIFAISLDVATPTEAVSPSVSSLISLRRRAAMRSACCGVRTRSSSDMPGLAARSTNASSSDNGSTSGLSWRSRRMMMSLLAR